jgi:hypothetical protein
MTKKLNRSEAIKRAIERVGKVNGQACGSQDLLDIAAHDYNIGSIVENFGKKLRSDAKKALESLQSASPQSQVRMDDAVRTVVNTEIAQNVDLGSGAEYQVTAKVVKGAEYMDTKALLNDIAIQYGDTARNELVKKHTKRRIPSIRYEVVEKL